MPVLSHSRSPFADENVSKRDVAIQPENYEYVFLLLLLLPPRFLFTSLAYRIISQERMNEWMSEYEWNERLAGVPYHTQKLFIIFYELWVAHITSDISIGLILSPLWVFWLWVWKSVTGLSCLVSSSPKWFSLSSVDSLNGLRIRRTTSGTGWTWTGCGIQRNTAKKTAGRSNSKRSKNTALP